MVDLAVLSLRLDLMTLCLFQPKRVYDSVGGLSFIADHGGEPCAAWGWCSQGSKCSVFGDTSFAKVSQVSQGTEAWTLQSKLQIFSPLRWRISVGAQSAHASQDHAVDKRGWSVDQWLQLFGAPALFFGDFNVCNWINWSLIEHVRNLGGLIRA